MHFATTLTCAVLSATAILAGCAETDEVGASTVALTPELAPGEILLDARPDGAALFGRPLPAPPNADPDRRLSLRVEPAGLSPDLSGAVVLDARFVEAGLAVLTESHALMLHSGGPESATITLDTEVEGPLSVEGDQIAYVRGAWPALEVARADASTGQARAVTHDLAPTWNPALTPDGAIIFVSGATGGPKLLRAEPSGGIVELPATRFPASATAPRVVDGALVFEDEAGAAWLDLSSGRVERSIEGRGGLAFLPDGRVLDGRLSPLGANR